MDEPLSNPTPTAGADAHRGAPVFGSVSATTTVYVTHDQTELTLATAAVMRAGKLQQVGPPQELYLNPINLFVAGFIGSPAMNFMPGTLEDGALRTQLGDITLSDKTRRALEARGDSRDVIMGVRPENFEDLSLVPSTDRGHGITFKEHRGLESLGSDVSPTSRRNPAPGRPS